MAVVCLWLGLAGGPAWGADSSKGVSEYQIKAVFLYNLTQFTDWPANTFTASDSPLVIGIVGEDPFGKTLDAAVKGERVRGRPLVVKRLGLNDDLLACQVLFISSSEKKNIPELLKRLKGSPVMSVGEASGFCEQGGMVNFLVPDKKVQIEINQTVAEEAGLQISAKLLKLARIVLSSVKD